MQVGRGDQELHGQTGTAAEQGMHAIAAQQWSEMVCRSMAGGGVGILSMPGQDGSTVDDQIASPNQMAAHSTLDHEHEEDLEGRRSCFLPAFAQLRRAWNARLASCVEWQATGQCQSRPTLQPIMHIPGRESRQSVLSKATSNKDSSR